MQKAQKSKQFSSIKKSYLPKRNKKKKKIEKKMEKLQGKGGIARTRFTQLKVRQVEVGIMTSSSREDPGWE